MSLKELVETARAMVENDKGLLAMDESTPTCKKRFAPLGIPQTPETRRARNNRDARRGEYGMAV